MRSQIRCRDEFRVHEIPIQFLFLEYLPELMLLQSHLLFHPLEPKLYHLRFQYESNNHGDAADDPILRKGLHIDWSDHQMLQDF